MIHLMVNFAFNFPLWLLFLQFFWKECLRVFDEINTSRYPL